VESPEKQFDVIIWGGYARGNTGDELCLAAALARAQSRFGGRVAILSPQPELTSWLFPGTTVVPFVPFRPDKRGRWTGGLRRGVQWMAAGGKLRSGVPDAAWARAICQSRALYLAGGGYLTDLFPLERILPPIRLARELKLPVVTSPLGIGPFASAAAADRVAALLRAADLRVRDEVSMQFCRQRGLSAALEPDDAFGLIAGWNRADAQPAPDGAARKIGVCIFAQYGRGRDCDLSSWWVEGLRRLQQCYPTHKIEGFCFHTEPREDFYQMAGLFQRAGLPPEAVRPPEWDFRRATAALGRYDLVVSTRFHAVVAAKVFRVPCVAIAAGDYYRAKMNAALCGDDSSGVVVDPAQGGPELLPAACRKVFTGKCGG
jgi:polysaccharide pyruvyl transferase WcaK-like protein